MIQDQLVEYISSQMKLGVSQDAIKATLTGAGWAVVDVEDTLKKINSAGSATAPAAKPVVAAPAGSSFSAAASPAAKPAEKGSEPQTIRVSDLISASSAVSTPAIQPKVSPLSSGAISAGRPVAQSAQAAMPNPKKSAGKFPMTIVWIVLVIVFAGLAGYFFYQNMTLSSQVGTVNTQTQGVSGQVSTLNAQVQALTASSTSMAAQLTSLGALNQNLKTELSFFMIPAGLAATTTNFSLNGILSGGKPLFMLTTVDGAKASVKNSADASVRSLLLPFASSSQMVQVTGTYIPGSSMLTILTVNGAPAYPPAPAPASTTAPTTTTPVATTTASTTASSTITP